MTPEQARDILGKIRNVTVAVCGDFCLDAYWILNPAGGEVSEETGLRTEAAERQSYSLGGASNVVANLAALKPKRIRTIGAVGDDMFGRELRRQLMALGVDISGLVVQKEAFDTNVFVKRILDGNEKPRVDLGYFNRRTQETDDAVLGHLEKALERFDAVVFNQQVEHSITNDAYLRELNRLFERHRRRVVLLDSRHFGHRIARVIRKLNAAEAARLCGVRAERDARIPLEDLKRYARTLYGRSRKPVFITRGSRGILVADAGGLHEIPGIQLLKKLDPVGAGDTVLSALALCLGAGVAPAEAADFANAAAAVTVQKLFQTGTASGREILDMCRDPDFVYEPERAEDIRKAVYVKGTEIERCVGPAAIRWGRIRHAVFDHDGTVSTLREGWELVMEPMMVKAILGRHYASADEAVFRRVGERVRDYIEKSTGIQTVFQMEGLIGMVREFGFVPEMEILDKWGYKKIYNDLLLKRVNQRIRKIKSGELSPSDFIVGGSVDMLKSLKDRGVVLVLASGTDREDVRREAALLGYAGLFEGGIYGAVRDSRSHSKKEVLDRILREHRLEGPELAVFGDGPVEMRECRKVKGIAVGVASDELRRHGLNTAKRTRLITAGAHLVVPDFTQHEKLMRVLYPEPHRRGKPPTENGG